MKFSLQLLTLVSLVFFALLALADEAPTELVIDTTYLPESCNAKAAKGDSIKVHYVRDICYIFKEQNIDHSYFRLERFFLMATSSIQGLWSASRVWNWDERLTSASHDRGSPLPLTRTCPLSSLQPTL